MGHDSHSNCETKGGKFKKITLFIKVIFDPPW